jgi:sorting nexin-29
MEKYYEFNEELHLLFIDFRQAYDSINRKELWKGLELLGIPKKYINLVKICNEKTICKIRYLQNYSKTFEVKSGLCQGDALSPTLFNLVLEKIVRDANEQRSMDIIGESVILAYADDIVVLGKTKEVIVQTTEKLVEASKSMGLCINENKTKYMTMSRNNQNTNDILISNMKIEAVDNFKYLGVNVNNNNNMHQEVNERIMCGNRCYYSIVKILKSKLLSRTSKILLYHSYLRPIVIYACETWSITKGDEKKLIIFERKILRNIYGSRFNQETNTYERRTNDELQKLYKRPNILAFIRNKRLEWFGHTWKADGQLIKKVLVGKINKTRPLGRPRTRWIDVISRDLKEIGQNVTFELTYNRDRWRDLLKVAMVLNGPVS